MTEALPAPAPAPGLELLGSLSGSGYRRRQALVRRADGQTVQLTPVLYALLELVDGRRGPEELADALSESIGKRATGDDVVQLLERLRPLGLLDGPEAEAAPRPQPLLGLRLRYVITDTELTRRITAPFAWLFRPWVVVPVLAVFFAVCWFVLVDKGLASATRQAFLEPEKLLAVFALTVLSAGFHEFGHAAACRYGGATPGAMGAGLYLVWPAFYTDVADSYRLSRWGRLRVDLGGLYFNAVAAVGVWGLWLLWRQDALLLAVAMQLLQMVRQLPPVIRADGYHILADLTGVPDLYHHLGPTLRRLLPWHWGEASPLRRRARWAVTAWTLAVVPILAAMVLTGILLFPRLVATAWEGGKVQAARLQTWDPVVAGAAVLKLVALVLPVLSVGFMAWQLLRRVSRRVWVATDDHPRRRAVVVLAGLVAAILLGSLWWPDGQYKPVRADERGTVLSLVRSEAPAPVAGTNQVPALALVPREDKTAPVLLLLPGEDGSGTQAVLTTADGQGEASPGARFPFTLPSEPRPGDNQALAVGDEDGKTVYDVAYALVTVTDGSRVTNANQAFALASCTACTTVAVAFQVILVVGQADVVVPVNTAVAGNWDCVSCVTTALAVQLVVTLQELPSQEVYDQLQAALTQLDGLEDLDPSQLLQTVAQVESQVVGILAEAGLVDGVTTATASASATPAAGGDATAEPSASASPSAEPSGSPSAEPPSPTPTAEPALTPSPAPSG